MQCQAIDTTLALNYFSPSRDLLFYLDQLRSARMTPHQALYDLTEQFGVTVNKRFVVTYTVFHPRKHRCR